MGVATTLAPNGLGPPNPTKKLAHWMDLLGQPLSRNHIFKILRGELSLNIKEQTELKVNWTQIDHFTLRKTTKMVISQNAIMAKCQSPKSLLLHFLTNLSETFRIDVNSESM